MSADVADVWRNVQFTPDVISQIISKHPMAFYWLNGVKHRQRGSLNGHHQPLQPHATDMSDIVKQIDTLMLTPLRIRAAE